MTSKAIISFPTKSAMQSGKAHRKWLLRYNIESNPHYRYENTGWNGSKNTLTQVTMRFDSKDDAIAYATRKKLNFIVKEPKVSSVKIQAYADNFC